MNKYNKIWIILKNDTLKNRNLGNILSILENKNCIIEEIFTLKVSKNFLCEFYSEHSNKFFFKEMLNVMLDKNILVVKFLYNISTETDFLTYLNKLKGNTLKPKVGTIRFCFAKNSLENSIHVSDSWSNFNKETKILEKYLKKNIIFKEKY